MTKGTRQFVVVLLVIIAGHIRSAVALFTELYVVPFPLLVGNDSDGSLARPYSSLQQAVDHIERERDESTNSAYMTTINLYPTHHFVDTVRFNHIHSRTRLTTMSAANTATFERLLSDERTHRQLPGASISGGVPITGWTRARENTYSAIVPELLSVNQLFVNDRRIVRTRVPMNQSDYLQYAAPLKDPIQARYGFQYAPGQFEYKSLSDAMVVVYHSWTTSHHYIDRLITENNTIFFTNPSDRPIGAVGVQARRRFHIENVCEALVPNSFCFVNDTKTVYLMTDGSYDPLTAQVITSVNDFVLVLASDDATQPIHDLFVENVTIQHGAWNIGRYEQADYQAAAFLTSAALFVANATSIVLSNVEISHTGTYGLWIKEGTTNIDLINSLVTDTGAGGVRIGQMISPVPTPTCSITIISNEVSYGGNVFPSGVAVISHRAVDVLIADNIIHHHRYTGISVGWQWGYDPSSTSHVRIQGNYIYNVGQHILNDQGGIYTLGIQPGTVIAANVIKNVFSFSNFMWGIYLDEGSSQILVSSNVVYNTGWAALFQHYGANNTIVNNVFARASLLPPPHPDDDYPDGDIHIALAEAHTSWTFSRNIVYDTYHGTNHSVYNSAPMVLAPFDNNVYYNPYGTRLLFGSQQTSFEEWQQTGQDKNSVMENPLFVGDVNQCDFFTIQSNSPAAKLGFSNLTKPLAWTPGCDMNDVSAANQYYQW